MSTMSTYTHTSILFITILLFNMHTNNFNYDGYYTVIL